MFQYIIVQFEFEGFHRWPEAPEEARHLANRHRHVFKVQAIKQVNHGNRDIEFQILKRDMLKFITATWTSKETGIVELADWSCELTAWNLMKRFDLCQCTVLEDGENGGGCARRWGL